MEFHVVTVLLLQSPEGDLGRATHRDPDRIVGKPRDPEWLQSPEGDLGRATRYTCRRTAVRARRGPV